MSKRSSFDKIPRELYETIDLKAVPPNLVKYIAGKNFYEPCVGSGKLANQLERYGSVCVGGSDIHPFGDWASTTVKGAEELTTDDLNDADLIITNPPFSKEILLPLIDHFINLKPTWLLLPSDYMHNSYFAPYMKKCSRVVSIGRLYWFKNTQVVDKPLKFDEVPEWANKRITKADDTLGIKYYSGWWDSSKDKPAKSEYMRSTENYSWYFWPHKAEEGQGPVFETRGD